MSGARLLFHLALLKDNRKLSSSNVLANLLILYKVKNERGRSRNIRPSHTIKCYGDCALNRKIHRINNMISCNFKNKSILFSESDFSDISHFLLSDLGSHKVTSFVMAAAKNTAIGINKKEYLALEKVFCEKITPEVAKSAYGERSKVSLFNEFSEKESKNYIEDFLEVYRFRTKIVDFTIDDIHGGRDKVIRISNRNTQSILDRLFKRLGKEHSSQSFLHSSIKKLSGSIFDLDFTIHTEHVEFKFNERGVWRN